MPELTIERLTDAVAGGAVALRSIIAAGSPRTGREEKCSRQPMR